ncbi:type II and III secretion system protein family protein [Schlesneria paludicola]|uniref:type II and III secretion system protein family protein n=1 Tax=Schlesneria paludicola TaxID=360056 RepID=UPI00029B5331|nr:pilus assembly protein N-terminal domain-containing protein [Schlesneria paludicola]
MSTIQPTGRANSDRVLSLESWCGFAFRQMTSRRLPWGCALAAALLAPAMESTARGQDPPESPAPSTVRRAAEDDRSYEAVKVISPKMRVNLTEKFSKDLEFSEWLKRVDGFDDKVINVMSLGHNRLRIRGLTQGVTTMVITGDSGQRYSIEVYVSGDARLLQAVLKENFPDSAIECRALFGGTILLTGYVTDNQTIAQIMDVARVYAPDVINHMRVGGPQEVQARVKILEVQRSKLRTFGINFQALTQSAVIASTPGSITPITSLVNPIGGGPSIGQQPSSTNPLSLTAGFSGNHFAFDLFVQALKEEGLLKVMSEPVLVVRSGEAARLEDGGEFPIPVPGGLGTVTIEFREFGVILQTLPIVISPTRVKLQVTAEVSDKDTANSITLQGTTVPGISKRKVQSTVDMNFGDTMVVGGLISTRVMGSNLKTPFLGELPLVGAMFRKTISQQSETELIILITPEFGNSMPSDQVPPGGPGMNTTVPTDRELYDYGLIEVPKYGPDCGTECDGNYLNRFQGDYQPSRSSIPISPAVTPTPIMGTSPSSGMGTLPNPTSGGLISPSGPGTTSPVPPPPSTENGLSRRTRSAKPPSRSKPPTTRGLQDTDESSVQPAGFKKSPKSERTTETQSKSQKRDETGQ